MVQMIKIRLHYAKTHSRAGVCCPKKAASPTTPHGQQSVVDRYAEHHHWNGGREQEGVFVKCLQRHDSEDKAQKHASGIAEKDCRRMKIVAEETETRTNEAEEYQHVTRHVVDGEDSAQASRRDDGQTGRQAVEAINQIESVNDGQKPQFDQSEINDAREFIAEKRPESSPGQGDKTCSNGLTCEFNQRAKPTDVIDDANYQEDNGCQSKAFPPLESEVAGELWPRKQKSHEASCVDADDNS